MSIESRTLPDSAREPELVPSARIRGLVALFLRGGLGFVLLNAGLLGYVAQSKSGGTSFGSNAWMAGNSGPGGVNVFFGAIPFLGIVLGVALILGFLTTVAAIGTFLLLLSLPCLRTIDLLINPNGPYGMNVSPQSIVEQTMVGAILSLLLMMTGAVLWFSPRASNPYSVDALMFPPPVERSPYDPRLSSPAPLPEALPSQGPAAYISPAIQAEIESRTTGY